MLDYPEELLPQERAALALWLFADGWRPTTPEAAHRLGLTQPGAQLLMGKLARVFEVSQDESGRWHLVAWRMAEVEDPAGEDPENRADGQ